jgi:hypothetical protein
MNREIKPARNVMNNQPSSRANKLFPPLLCTAIALALQPLSASALDGVRITGTNTDFAEQSGGSAEMSIAKQQLCSMEGLMAVNSALRVITSRMDPRLGSLASAAGASIPSEQDVFEAMNELCKEQEPFTTAPFNITYAQCRMTMDSAGQMLDIVIPPGGTEGRMDVADFGRNEAMRVLLQRDLAATAEVVGRGWSNTVDMKSLGSGGEVAGYPTTKYQFTYSGGLGGGVAPGAGMVSTTSSGFSWISDKVDGINVVQDFYRTFTSEIDATQGSGSFMSGLISNLVVMLENGMPLKMDQTVESKIAGMSMAGGRSTMEVYTVRRVKLPDDWCGQNFLPPGMPITDVNEQINEAMGQSGNAEAAAAMADAQKQMDEAFKNLTPEQRKMMEGMGLDKLMGGQKAAPAATTGAAAAAAAAQPRAAAKAAPDPYYSDNTTQMVQRQLKALGYDPGNTDGKESMQTSIAISQFQAENNLPVTGKASPQLAGVLSARLAKP